MAFCLILKRAYWLLYCGDYFRHQTFQKNPMFHIKITQSPVGGGGAFGVPTWYTIETTLKISKEKIQTKAKSTKLGNTKI